jgi:hypothetical protein
MSTIINLYNDGLVPQHIDQNNPPTISGTWTYTGSGSTGAAPLPPSPPGSYNSDIDFAGVANGVYEYTYTVTNGSCSNDTTVTVTVGDHIPVINDTCATAKVMGFPYGGGCSELTNQTLVAECPGPAEPTFDGSIAAPSQWGSATFDSDLWYQFSYDPANNPGGASPNNMVITVSGTAYGASGITNPAIALYTSCSAGSLQTAEIGNGQEHSILESGIFNTSFTYYIRVSAPDGSEGKFDISISI